MKRIEVSHVMVAALIVVLLALVTLLAQAQTREIQKQRNLSLQSPTPMGQATAPSPSSTESAAIASPSSASPAVSPDVTANWSVYRNQELGFEFRYPVTWGSIEASLKNGEQGQQLEAHTSAKSFFFGGNSPDYKSGGGGAQFYDFY